MRREESLIREGNWSSKYRDSGCISQCHFDLSLRGSCVTAMKLLESYRRGK